jgi:hypothetical protein
VPLSPPRKSLSSPYDMPNGMPRYQAGELASLVPEEMEPLGQPEDTEPAEEVSVAPTQYRTSLKLSEAQLKRMMEYVKERVSEIRKEMGLSERTEVEADSWMAIRERNQATYDGDLRWRMLEGSIFEKSNLTLGTNVRHVKTLSAVVQDHLIGTSPFFSVMPKKNSSLLAKQIEEYAQGAIDESTVLEGLRSAIKKALIVNEAVVKTSYVVDSSPYIGPATVYVDEMGVPIRTPEKKLFVFKNDDVFDSPMVEPEIPPAPDPLTGMTPPPAPKLLILRKDPSFQMYDQQYALKQFDDLPLTLTHYEGPKAEPLDHRCFLCSLTAPSIHAADLNGHLFRETPMRMKEIYGPFDVGGSYFNSTPTGDKAPKEIQGEKAERTSSVLEEGNFAELYFRFDANEDGRAEDIFLVVDTERMDDPIFYDFMGNHFDERPFQVIPGVEQVAGRWYGRGVFSLGEDEETAIDVQWNRAITKGSRTSSLLFRRKGAVEQWDNGLPVVFGDGRVLDVNPGFDGDKNTPIFSVNVAEPIEQAADLMEIARAASDAKFGSISPQDASLTKLNNSNTATGVVNIQASADVITKATELAHIAPVTRIMFQVIKVTLKNMPESVLMYSEDTGELVTLNKDEIASLEKKVKLTLTRSRSTQMQQTNQTALAVVKDYRATMLSDPEGAKMQRDFYIGQLKGMEVSDADEVCPEITDDMILQFKEQQQAAAMAEQQEKLNGKNPAGTRST